MKISVLLVNWNGIDDVRNCLMKLRDMRHPDFEVILADNGSTDGSPEMIRNEFPQVELLDLGDNTGFAHANNAAAEKARGELLFVVNVDTDMEPDLLDLLDNAAVDFPEYDIFSCQMIQMAARDRVDCKGMTFEPTLTARMLDIDVPVDDAEAPFEIFGATGGAMLIRRRVYETIGLFDDALFFNNEDVDFSLRAYGAGFRTLYLPAARVYHRRSPSQDSHPDLVLYYIQRNIVLAAYKNVPTVLWLGLGPVHLAYNAYQLAKWTARGKGSVVLKAKWDAIKAFKKFKRTPMGALRMLKALGRKRLK